MNKQKLIWQLPFLILLIVGTVLIIRQQRDIPYQTNSGMVFGTIYNITYECDSDLHQAIPCLFLSWQIFQTFLQICSLVKNYVFPSQHFGSSKGGKKN